MNAREELYKKQEDNKFRYNHVLGGVNRERTRIMNNL